MLLQSAVGDRLAALLGQAEALGGVLARGKLPNEASLTQVLDHISDPSLVRGVPHMMSDVPSRGSATVVVVVFLLGILEKAGKRMAERVAAMRRQYGVDGSGGVPHEAEFMRIVDAYDANRAAFEEARQFSDVMKR